MQSFLEANENDLEKNLRFIDNPVERELNKIMGSTDTPNIGAQAPPRDYKVLTPVPAMCLKFLKLNSDEKFFVNICTTDELPAPPDVTEEELAHILETEDGDNYRIPMSISEPRWTTDKSGNPAQVVDIAINPQFVAKVKKSQMFREFLVNLIAEAISDKYNYQLNVAGAIILKRRCIGTLVQHRVRNQDVKAVLDTAANGSFTDKKELVTEIKAKKTEDGFIEPEYKLFIKEGFRKDNPTQVIAQFYMPECTTGKGIKVDVSDDRLVVTSPKHFYKFDRFVPFKMDEIELEPTFNKISKILTVIVPLQETKTIAAKEKKGS